MEIQQLQPNLSRQLMLLQNPRKKWKKLVIMTTLKEMHLLKNPISKLL